MQNMLFTLFFLTSFSAFAETNYSLNLGLRSKPTSANIVGQAAYDGMLWGQRDGNNPLYGFYRVGVKLGGSPTAAAFFQVAPIAPLVFEVQKGTTKRVLNQSSFDCDASECKGKVDRTDYLMKFALSHQNYVFTGQALWRDIKTEDESKPIALELENFLVTPGTHNYFEATAMGGYKLPDNRLAGLLLYSAQISDGHQRFTAGYGVYRFKWDEYSVSTGAGIYKSDYRRMTGPSVIFSIARTWGEVLSLF